VSVPVSTHVLDTTAGSPAQGVPVVLERAAGAGWEPLGSGTTGPDGRVGDIGAVDAGRHRLRFDTGAFSAFYPEVTVQFAVAGDEHHLHLPLLLNPFGYSTYRGS
jgi:5-hydroxyisourate hydrolase